MVVTPPRLDGPSGDRSASGADVGAAPRGFALIPAGWIAMGSADGQADERPVHHVWVDAFEMAIAPVTREAYAEFLSATEHPHPREWGGARTLPTGPTGGGRQLGRRRGVLRLAVGRRIDRPLAERSPVGARGTGTRHRPRYPDGDTVPSWVPNEGRGPLDGPWPVTLGEPSDFGLYGIGANIHEWCTDWHAADFYGRSPALNPTGPVTGVRRASRGGAWRHATTVSRVAARSRLDPTYRYTDYGFRLARPATCSP